MHLLFCFFHTILHLKFSFILLYLAMVQFSSVQFSCSVMSDSATPWSTARQPSLSITISRSSLRRSLIVPFSSYLQSLPASESFPMSHLFAWGGRSTGVSALASFLSKNTQGWSPLEWTGWISLQYKGLSRVFSNTIVEFIVKFNSIWQRPISTPGRW